MNIRCISLFVFLSYFLFTDLVYAKTVLVTGSNRGMGLEFVIQYAEKGWNVIATSRSPSDDFELIDLAKKNPKIQVEQMDVTNTNQIQMLAKKYENQPWMKRSEEYKKMKVDFKNKMLKKLFELFPETKGRVIQTEVSTPLSTKHFTQNQKGEIYGLEHSPNRFSLPFLKTETKIKGLRLLGQDITSVGVSGAMFSGLMGAIVILKFKFWKEFRKINKPIAS